MDLKIILVHRVSQTAMSIIHILLFFVCGVGSVFYLVFNGNQKDLFGDFGRSFVSTLSIVTGEFELGTRVGKYILEYFKIVPQEQLFFYF